MSGASWIATLIKSGMRRQRRAHVVIFMRVSALWRNRLQARPTDSQGSIAEQQISARHR
jgi:hypothetical protein